MISIRILQKSIFSILFFVCANTHSWWFDVQPLATVLQQNPHISYTPCSGKTPFCFKQHPFYLGDALHPFSGTFEETFILSIPNGIAHSHYGWVVISNMFIKEMIWKDIEMHLQSVYNIATLHKHIVHDKVVVLGQLAYFNYFHMLSELLGRLALVEMHGIAYDKVFIPQNTKFLKEALQLWGLSQDQIIDTFGQTFCIQADTLILPSMVGNITGGLKLFSCYPRADLLGYVKEKLLKAALAKPLFKSACEKVFISRKDAPARKIINEDEVFAQLQPLGFKRYVLSDLSVAQQIQLFHHAKVVIGAQGTSLANSMFCKPHTKVIELFQGLDDTTIAFVAQIFDLDYLPVQTTAFSTDYIQALKTDTVIPLHVIQKVIQHLL